MRAIKIALTTLVLLLLSFSLWVYLTTYHPAPREPATLACQADMPVYDPAQPLRVMVYNVQFFAGKDYVFYYDLPDGIGPDLRPSTASIDATLDGIADLIAAYNPDILLLQEVNDGAAATDYHDQTAQLLERLPNHDYGCVAEAFYWRAGYIPHPHIMGSVGMKLVTLSRYEINDAWRIQLPRMPMDIVSAQFYLKRAMLTTDLTTTEGDSIQLLNTHLDAFAQGSDTMQQQVAMVHDTLSFLDQSETPWLLGGDLNLLAPGQRERLAPEQRAYYVEPSELEVLMEWDMVPSLVDIQTEPERWYTHYPNDPRVAGPDRTIDFLFHSHQWQVEHAEVVMGHNALGLSDHLPIVVDLRLTE
ncbi:endonuclease/exonuclease/phosphatase family protein [Salinispirillum sp. LH 10-3-1]|uniref:Endonuclease/exonuclease/phosphatase family protein n=1 Tax=Salinispirillum sp. LH 10-3-1 TaxID=2952525 RepID=A0AB38YH40_9GAMM